MFRNAAILFGIGDGILEFFTKVSPPQNDLQRIFINAWANFSQMHLKCLGILHCLLTGPWMDHGSQSNTRFNSWTQCHLQQGSFLTERAGEGSNQDVPWPDSLWFNHQWWRPTLAKTEDLPWEWSRGCMPYPGTPGQRDDRGFGEATTVSTSTWGILGTLRAVTEGVRVLWNYKHQWRKELCTPWL